MTLSTPTAQVVCVWDLLTGACVYSIQAHVGPVLDLDYSASCVVSLGQDGKLCVWERWHGHLLNCVDTVSRYKLVTSHRH